MKRSLVISVVMVAIGASMFVALEVGLPVGAVTHTCNTNWCSGSDDTTGTNAEGNISQIYLGEIGYYASDTHLGGTQVGPCPGSSNGNVPGGDGTCFNGVAATNTVNRYTSNSGSIGVDYIWFGGGPSAAQASSYPSLYCWGWAQGYAAENQINQNYAAWDANADLLFMDIEQNGKFGWQQASSETGTAADNNRTVYNGFSDYVAGRVSKQPTNCSGSGAPFQYGVYSAPYQWMWSFDAPTACGSSAGTYGNLPNTFIWTSENIKSTDSDPQSFTGSGPSTSACWFASSSYDVGWQFYHSPDNDVFYEPQTLYVTGGTWGT